MARFAVTADLHIDAGWWGAADERGRPQSWRENEEVWDAVVSGAIDRGADAFLSLGDLTKDGRPRPEAVAMLVDGHRRLHDAGIPSFALLGNHELKGTPRGQRTLLALLAQAGVVVVEKPAVIEIAGVDVAFMPWPTRAEYVGRDEVESLSPDDVDVLVSAGVADEIVRLAGLVRPGGVLVGHFAVDRAKLTDAAVRGSEIRLGALSHEPVVPFDVLADERFAAVLLGHIHKPQTLGGIPTRMYVGAPQRLDRSDEHHVPSWVLVDVSDGTATVERIPTPARRYRTVRVRGDLGAALADVQAGDYIHVVAEERVREMDLRAAIETRGGIYIGVDQPTVHSAPTHVDIAFDAPVPDAFSRWAVENPADPDNPDHSARVEADALTLLTGLCDDNPDPDEHAVVPGPLVVFDSVEMQGFGPYRSAVTVDLSRARLAAIVGENGAGKSTIVEAILFALFGWTRGRIVADCISRGADQATVALNCHAGGDTYRIIRTVSRRSGKRRHETTANIFQNDCPDAVAGPGPAEVTAKIRRDILGQDLETFIQTSFCMQDDADRFSSARAADRKNMLVQLLGLGSYERLYRLAQTPAGQHEARVAQLCATIEAAEKQLDDVASLESAAVCAREAQEEAAAALAEVNARLATLAVPAADPAAARVTLARVQADAAAVAAAVAEVETLTPKIDAAASELAAVETRRAATADDSDEAQRDDLQRRRALAGSRRSEAESRLAQFLGEEFTGVCWTCEQPVGAEKLGALIVELTATSAEAAAEEAEVAAALAALDENRRRRRAEVASLDRRAADLRRFLDSTRQRLHRAEAVAARLGEVREQLSAAQAAVDAAEAQHSPGAAEARQRAEAESAEAARTLAARAAEAGRLDGQLAQLKKLAESLVSMREEMEAERRSAEAWRYVCRALHRDGIPSAVLARAVAVLSERLAEVTKTLSNGRLAGTIVLDPEGPDGKRESSLEVMVDIGGEVFPYSLVSGSERFRVDLGLHVALADILGRRTDLFVVDEGWGCLDPGAGVEAMVDMMRALSHTHRVLTVTHIPAVAAAFDATWTVAFGVNGSTVTFCEEAA